MALLLLLSVTGWALLLYLHTRRSIALCLFAAVPGITALLYLAGLAGFLGVAAHALFYGGVAAALICGGLAARRRYRWALRGLGSPGFVVLIAAALLVWPACRTAHYYLWDEFSHWGLAAKEMAETHALPERTSVLFFRDYPPATALFEYYATANTGYSEGTVYYAHFLLMAAPLAVFFDGARWRKWYWVAAIAITLLLLFETRGDNFVSLYVDHTLSAYFAAAVFVQLRTRDPVKMMAYIMPTIFILPIVKKTGYFFALFAVIIIAVDNAARLVRPGTDGGEEGRRGLARLGDDFRRLWEAGRRTAARAPRKVFYALSAACALGTALWRGWASLGSVLIWALVAAAAAWAAALALAGEARGTLSRARARHAGRLLVVVLVVLSPVAAAKSWQWWVAKNGFPRTFNKRMTDMQAFRAALSPRTELHKAIVAGFRERFVHCTSRYGRKSAYDKIIGALYGVDTNTRGLTVAGWLVLATVFAAALVIAARPWRRKARYAAGFAVLVAGFGIYLLGLLMLYISAFSEPEGRAIAQFDRYTWIYILPIVLVTWGLLVHEAVTGGRRLAGGAVMAIAALFILRLYLFENCSYWPVPQAPERLAVRGELQKQAEFIRSRTGPKDSVFVIYQHTDTFELKIIRFELPYLRYNISHYSLGTPTGPEDLYTFDVTPKEWADILRKNRSKYVYLAHVDEEFWRRYGELFEADTKPADFFFRVDTDQAGNLILRPVR